jgi:hypothetical protein
MNTQEFAALKIGDKIENPMTHNHGVVTETTDTGVRVRWGDGSPGNNVSFMYPLQSTAWMHWCKAE